MPLPLSQEKRQEWEEIIRKQRESGYSAQRWCKENNVSITVFYYWKTKLFPKPLVRRSFTELADVSSTGIAIEYHGVHIRLEKHFEPLTLQRCLRALKEMSC